MSIREEIFGELKALCEDSGLDFETTSQELSEFIGSEEIVTYCATKGPLPSYPDTVFDIMVLSNKCIYDYEMKQKGSLHHMLPLKAIIEVAESFMQQKDEDYLSVSFRASSLGTGLAFQGKLKDQKKIRRFTSAVSSKIMELL